MAQLYLICVVACRSFLQYFFPKVCLDSVHDHRTRHNWVVRCFFGDGRLCRPQRTYSIDGSNCWLLQKKRRALSTLVVVGGPMGS